MLQLESRVESTTSSMERNQIGVLTIGTIPRRLPVSYRLRSCDLAFCVVGIRSIHPGHRLFNSSPPPSSASCRSS